MCVLFFSDVLSLCFDYALPFGRPVDWRTLSGGIIRILGMGAGFRALMLIRRARISSGRIRLWLSWCVFFWVYRQSGL